MRVESIGNLTEILSGFAFDSKHFGAEVGMPMIRIRDVVRGTTNTKYAGEFDEKYVVDNGDVLIGMDGEFNVAKWQGGPALLNQRVCKIKPSSKYLDGEYLFRFLPQQLKKIEAATPYVTVKHLSVKTIRDIEIPLPPLEEQRRIAEVLNRADALRQKRWLALQKLETLLQSVFLDMFGDPVTNPKGWEIVPLKELLYDDTINGAYYPKEHYSDKGTRMVHMADAFYGIVDVSTVKRVDVPKSDIDKYGLVETDLLVSRRSLNYEGSAKPCRIPKLDEPLIFESSLIRVRPKLDRILTIYLYHYLQNDAARARYIFPLVTRSTISGINQSNLLRVSVVTPPLALQRRFAGIVNLVERENAAYETQLNELDALFASLQSRVFRGELNAG